MEGMVTSNLSENLSYVKQNKYDCAGTTPMIYFRETFVSQTY